MRNKADSPTARNKASSNSRGRVSGIESLPLRRSSLSHIPERDWRACFLLMVLIFSVATYQYFQTSATVRQYSDTYVHLNRPQGVPVKQAANHIKAKGVGFVLLGLGPFARQLKCEAAIESLRRNGGWDGPVFLLTDAPKCYLGNSIFNRCSINATIVDVNDNLSSGFALPSLYKTRGNRLKSKKYKTRIFQLIDDPSIDVLVYMDCDMLIAETGEWNGTRDFLNRYTDSFAEDSRLFVFPENNPSKINGIVHTGIFIAHRNLSASLLQKWAAQLDTEKDASDQAAFIRAGITEYRFMDESRFLYRPRCDRDDCLTKSPSLFNHINGARCWNQGREEIQMFVNRWRLCTYASHNYCYPMAMTPFAMSWLPHPSCKKLEEKRTVLKT